MFCKSSWLFNQFTQLTPQFMFQHTVWLWLLHSHGFSMALIEIDDLSMIFPATSTSIYWDFPWQTVGELLVITRGYSAAGAVHVGGGIRETTGAGAGDTATATGSLGRCFSKVFWGFQEH
jgi:hypothetical protein